MLGTGMDFSEALERLGFAPALTRSSKGQRTYSSRPNGFLTCWVHAYDDGSALFTWEFAVTDYLASKGIQLGSSESLNLFMFPMKDQRGSQDPAWLAQALDSVDRALAEVNFANPEG